MATSKYGKYIISELKQPAEEAPWNPPVTAAGKGKGGRVLFLDSNNVPGAFYMECVWVMPRPPLTAGQMKPPRKEARGRIRINMTR